MAMATPSTVDHRAAAIRRRVRIGFEDAPKGSYFPTESESAGQREIAREAYRSSRLAQSIVSRLADHVVNSGLSWESTPEWGIIKYAPKTEMDRLNWTEKSESLFSIFAESTDVDVRGKMTLYEIQQNLYRKILMEGEFFVIIHYSDDPSRLSPISLQILNNDQIYSPIDGAILHEMEDMGHTLTDGMEFDSAGRWIAIHVWDSLLKFNGKSVRIPVYGDDGRRHVIHGMEYLTGDEVRGVPPLSFLLAELKDLNSYHNAEMQNAKASAAIMAVVEVAPGSTPGGSIMPGLVPDDDEAPTTEERPIGLEKVPLDSGMSIICNNLAPGETFKGFSPSHPNQNYAPFVDSREGAVVNSLGCSLSFIREKFAMSYSASRAEILLQWNNIAVRRGNFARSFLYPICEAWMGEEIRAGNIIAAGFFNDRKIKMAWLKSSWVGISRPVVDPVKEIDAIQKRIEAGHTTGTKESQAYNGSDFYENVKKLATENEFLSAARASIEALKKPQIVEPEESENDEEN